MYVKVLNKIIDDIQKFGWSVIGVPLRRQNGFAYTIGLWEKYQHPEIFIFGLPIDMAHFILNDLGMQIKKKGVKYELEQNYNEVIVNYPVQFKQINSVNYDLYLGIAVRYYGDSDFLAHQMFWTDINSKFPWENGSQNKDFQVDFSPAQRVII